MAKGDNIRRMPVLQAGVMQQPSRCVLVEKVRCGVVNQLVRAQV